MSKDNIEEIVQFYTDEKHRLKLFLDGVQAYFTSQPLLNRKPQPIVHSTKSRMKSTDSLVDKIKRKRDKGKIINRDNLFQEVNDLVGVRVLHLYQDQFPDIHHAIQSKINVGDWKYFEEPKAYTWDPESKKQYADLGIRTEVKDSFYTSVHYVIAPNNNNKNVITCEIQVRTLFEEIWGEIDHTINYPHPTGILACKEQLRVLSKLISTGTRLADSIFRTHNEK